MNPPSVHPPPRAGVSVRLLGALAVTDAAGEPSVELLARPKALALLVVLVLGRGAGAHGREALAGLLWPESDTERARGSLRQAILQLRRVLGAGAIVGRGADVALASGAVRADVLAFEQRLATGDTAGAIALYDGDLLPGFFVDGAPGFERWLDAQRRRLREAAVAGARALVDASERGGDPDAAVAWARRAVALAGDDERAVRRLIGLLDRAGDRPAALRAYETFAARIRAELGVDPAPETTALAAGLREAAPHDDATLDPRRVVVVAFENATGDAAHDSFGRLAADTVAQAVARLDAIEVVPLTAALVSARYADVAAAGRSGVERARLVAEDTRAGTVVGGTYYRAGHELVLQAWIGDARTGQVLQGVGPVRAPIDAPLAAMARVAEESTEALARRFETRVAHLRATSRAPSYDAHRAYVEGQARFVDGDWSGALRDFERAADCDAGYALPLLVSAIARWNLGELEAAESAVERALPLMRGAGRFERALFDMVRAWLAGDWAAAYDAVRRQSELAPGSIASFQVAEEARRRNRPREALRQLATLDPMRGELRGWVFYWVVQAQSLHMLGEHERELESALRARALHPESALALRLETHARAALGDVPGVLACIQESLSSPGRSEPRPGALMREAAHELLAHGHAADAAGDLLRQALAWHEELAPGEGTQARARRALARARYDAGDWAGAQAEFAALAGDAPAVDDCGAIHHPHLQAHLDHGYLGVLAVRRGDAAAAARIDAQLAAARGRHLFGSTHYWRAAMAAVRGDADGATRLLRQALAAGLPLEPFIHADPHFAAARDTAAFATLLAPRG